MSTGRHSFHNGVVGALVLAANAAGQGSFVNFESPHVHPMDLTPDGQHLLVVNTADNRLEVFAIVGGELFLHGTVPVGLEPVSVRARTATEAWVVNNISDSVSVVDLTTMNVVSTLYPGDEPADVVFAGSPERAFVTVSQLNEVKVYDPADLAAAPIVIDIEGEDPRALATDGVSVYAAIFESGNSTTIISATAVSTALNPYPGDPNPPPNSGLEFNPPIAGGLPPAPDVSIIVRDAGGAWLDDNGFDWSAAVPWDTHDHDIAIIDADTLAVDYAVGTMNLNMAVAMHPTGALTVVGTEALNELRFEPNIAGIFVQSVGATLTGPGGPAAIVDLNGHLDYSSSTVAQPLRDLSIGDPRGIAWRADGLTGFVTGMGSNNVTCVDAGLGRIAAIEVGEGPTGVVVDEANDAIYVLNKFEASISVVDGTGLVATSVVSFHDATPAVIKTGRPHLYDTHETSGLGQVSCGSCHIDGRMDQLAWDLGDPSGAVKVFNQSCNFGLGGCENWHPMKGPMMTQTLLGLIGDEPFHWRGDREGLQAFNPAFESLLGDDEQLTAPETAEFLAFVATLTPPPNPFRNLDNSLPSIFPNSGNPVVGQTAFLTANLDGDAITCASCHAPPTGTIGEIISGPLLQESQSMKVPQLRNMYEKTGFDQTSMSNNRGFGYTHDGAVDSLFNFLFFDGFTFVNGQQRLDVEAFVMCFTSDTHAGTGTQAMLPDPGTADQPAVFTDLVSVAGSPELELIVKGIFFGETRGLRMLPGGVFQSDRASQTVTLLDLINAAGPGSELTFTLVPAGSGERLGVDRDEDGFLDRDELDAGSNPADPISTPDNVGDLDGDGMVGIVDLLALLAGWGPCPGPPLPCPTDLDGDGSTGITDLLVLLANWG